MTRSMWPLFALALLAGCADRSDPPAAPPPAPVSTPSAPLSAAPPVDASAPDLGSDAALNGDAGGTDASADGGPGADGGIKIIAQAPIFIADEAPKPKPKRARKKRAPKKPKPVAKAPSKPAPKARRISPMQTIRAHYGDVHHCYARVALKDPTVAGRVTLQWTIGKSGMPQAVAITKNTLKDKSVGKCLKARAKTWKFPAPGGGVQVISYPFDLRVQ